MGFLAAPQEKEWSRLTAALAGVVDLAGDHRFASRLDRLQHQPALAELLAGVFATRSAEEWERDLVPAGIGCVAVAEAPPEAVLLGELGRSSGILADIVHPIFDEYPRLGPLVRVSRSATVAQAGCLIGQHTDAVLHELGYSDEGIADLRARNVVR